MTKMLEEPKVTVLMPVYNGEEYLREAIDSILSQTFADFEFLIINDGSTDGSVEIIESYQDPRIRLFHNESNLNLRTTLNKGLKLARGEYIARMDCDDVSLPQRLAKQVKFMDLHPDIGICGSGVKLIGNKLIKNKNGSVWKYPEDSSTIRCKMIFESPLAHPTLIMRNNLLVKFKLNYRTTYAEDYDFLIRSSKHFSLANMAEILLFYRIHSDNISKLYKNEYLISSEKIRMEQLKALGLKPKKEEFALHSSLSRYSYSKTESYMKQSNAWLCKLRGANMKRNIYPERVFSLVLGEKWRYVCYSASDVGFLKRCKIFFESPLRKYALKSLILKIKKEPY